MTPYWIYGAGAVGSALAGYLARRGHRVGITARKPHREVIRSQGLRVVSYEETFSVRLESLCRVPRRLLPETIILLTVQSQDVNTALAHLAPLTQEHAVVTFQNGIQAETMAQSRCPFLYGGIIRFTATMMRPGEVRVRYPGQVIVGKHPEGIDKRVTRVVADLNAAGFKSAASPEIGVEKALKLVVNLVSGPAVLMKRTRAEPILATVQVALLEEAKAVYKAHGIRAEPLSGLGVPLDDMIRIFQRGGSAPDGKPVYNSTWQNLFHKRKQIENRYYHGEIMRLGIQAGISTPVNQRTLELLEEASENHLGPEPYSPSEFRHRYESVLDFSKTPIAAEANLGNLEI